MLAVAFVLSIGAFVFAAGEARAQQQPDTTVTYTVVIDGEVTEQTAETPTVEETYLVKTSPVETSPVKSPPPVVHTVPPASEPLNEYDLEAPPVDPDPVPGEDPELEPVPAPEPGSPFLVEPVPPVDPAPAVDQHDPGMEPAPELVFEPVALEENEPLPSPVEEAIPALPDPREEGLHPLPDGLETAVSSAVETLESAATDVLGGLTDGSLLSDLFSGGEADLPVPADRGEDPGSSPFKLLLPVGSDLFSLLGSETGSGGAPLLLLCVLASSLVLLRRERKLLWASRELPKPSSVPRPALERPG